MSTINTLESSLTAPEDRDKVNKWLPQQTVNPLTNDQTNQAMKELYDTNFVTKYPKVDRVYADPPMPMQNFSLFSFVPAKGAKANENGIFGFCKIRNTFNTEEEARQRAEFLIKNVDSYNQIFTVYTGRPFPITNTSDYSAEVSEVELKKEMAKTISEDVKTKKDTDKQEIKTIMEREKELLAISKKNQEESKQNLPVEELPKTADDHYENYITLRVKKAQLSWTYLEHIRKMAEVKEALLKAREDIAELDLEYPDFKDSFLEKYMQARADSGLVETKEEAQKTFIQYLVEEADLGF